VVVRILCSQAPIPVTEGEGICAKILNSDDCATAIEARQIPLTHGRVRRDSAGLQLRLSNGRTLTVVNDTVDTSGAWPSWFHYLGTSDALGYHVLWAQHTEGGTIRIVNARSGWSADISDLPIASPDRRRFVTASQAMERYNPERLQVWRVEGDTLRPEWSLVFDFAEVPGEVRWLSARSFEFARMRALIGAFQREALDTVELNSIGVWSIRSQR
jgi:hypothetical protein